MQTFTACWKNNKCEICHYFDHHICNDTTLTSSIENNKYWCWNKSCNIPFPNAKYKSTKKYFELNLAIINHLYEFKVTARLRFMNKIFKETSIRNIGKYGLSINMMNAEDLSKLFELRHAMEEELESLESHNPRNIKKRKLETIQSSVKTPKLGLTKHEFNSHYMTSISTGFKVELTNIISPGCLSPIFHEGKFYACFKPTNGIGICSDCQSKISSDLCNQLIQASKS